MMAARKQGSKVEVLDDRTDSSQTFANPDGTFSYQAYAIPQWIQQSGTWKALDPTLTATATGSYAPALSQSPLVLSGGGSGPLATMTENGKQFSVTWPTALPAPTVSGATATYADVLPSGVDLQVTATAAGGIEETLIVENAAAAADPALADLEQTTGTSAGDTVSVDAGGNLTVADSHGNTLVTSPAPVMWDSATSTAPATAPDSPDSTASASPSSSAMTGGANAAGPEQVKVASLDEGSTTHSTSRGPGSRAHQARVKVTVGNHRLGLSPDHSLLTAKSTVFPVYIDPAYVPHPATGTTLDWDEVQQAYPTTSNYNAAPGDGLAVGYQGFSSPTGIERSFYELSIPSAVDKATILSATLNTTVTYAATSGSNSDTVGVFSACAMNSATDWNNQPCKYSVGNPNYPNANATATFTTTSTSPNKAVSFNVTAGLQAIANGSSTNWTLGLFNSTETNDVDLVRFADNPTFTITYNHPPATPASTAMTPSNTVGSTAYSSSGTPKLSSSATDADGDTVQLDYQVLSGSTVEASGATAFVNSGTAATWAPTTALANGAYTWQVRAYDGQAYSAWSAASAFTVDTTAPPAPTVSCGTYPANAWTAPVQSGSACTFTDTSGDVSGYQYSLDGAAPVTVNGSTGTATVGSMTGSPAGASFTGWHTLSVKALSDAAVPGTATAYGFGVGSAGMNTPDQSTSSTTFPLSATVDAGVGTTGYFQYRVGTTGSFTTVPVADVLHNGSALASWPVGAVNEVFNGTSSSSLSNLTWDAAHTLNQDGLVQIEAVFTNGSNTWTTAPISVTLDRLGNGTDFGTTSAGPVTVGLQSGNASVGASDVSIASFGSGLGVSRTFNSLSTRTTGIFGPGWTSSLPVAGTSDAWSSLTDSTTYAVLVAQDGSKLTFATGATTGTTTAYTPQGPAEVAGLTLVKNASGFQLTDQAGNQVNFTAAAGANAGTGQYLPLTVVQPNSTGSTGYYYDPSTSSSTYGDPLLAVAPDANAPAGTASTTACPYPASASTWGAGCRGLQFTYDPTTGNLAELDFVTSDGTTLTRTAVADYSYDASGRLAAEWDPRISPALKTAYTYDETATDPDYGRLTRSAPPSPPPAASPPGSWPTTTPPPAPTTANSPRSAAPTTPPTAAAPPPRRSPTASRSLPRPAAQPTWTPPRQRPGARPTTRPRPSHCSRPTTPREPAPSPTGPTPRSCTTTPRAAR